MTDQVNFSRRHISHIGALLAVVIVSVCFFLTMTKSIVDFSSTSAMKWKITAEDRSPEPLISHEPWLASMMKDVVDHQNLTDNPPLRDLCESTTWHPGAYVMCDDNPGGIGNVGALVLGCVRTAIHAGAGLVVPKILIRHPEVLTILQHDYVPLSYMFSQTHFETMLRLNCPQMPVLAEAGSISRLFRSDIPPPMDVHFPDSDPSSPEGSANLSQKASTFQAALYGGLASAPSAEMPALIRCRAAIVSYPAHSLDSPPVFASFGKLLVFNNHIYELAASIHAALKKRSTAYFGVHLRTEADAPPSWATYEAQRDLYLNTAVELNFSTIYIASGDNAGIEALREAAKDLNIECLSKDDLLSEEDKTRLQGLRWDERALIDYLILLKSDFFKGGVQSSFDYLSAASRHIIIQQTTFPFPKDAFSELAGAHLDSLFESGIWPLWA